VTTDPGAGGAVDTYTGTGTGPGGAVEDICFRTAPGGAEDICFRTTPVELLAPHIAIWAHACDIYMRHVHAACTCDIYMLCIGREDGSVGRLYPSCEPHWL